MIHGLTRVDSIQNLDKCLASWAMDGCEFKRCYRLWILCDICDNLTKIQEPRISHKKSLVANMLNFDHLYLHNL